MADENRDLRWISAHAPEFWAVIRRLLRRWRDRITRDALSANRAIERCCPMLILRQLRDYRES